MSKRLALLIAAALVLRWFLRQHSTPERGLPLLEDDDWLGEDTYTAALARRLAA